MVTDLLRVLISAAFVSVLAISGCGAQTALYPERCIVIVFDSDQESGMLPNLMSFAEEFELTSTLTNGVAKFEYRSNSGERFVLSYITNLGRFDAALNVYRTDEQGFDELMSAFDLFLEEDIRESFQVENCDDVPGLGPFIYYQ